MCLCPEQGQGDCRVHWFLEKLANPQKLFLSTDEDIPTHWDVMPVNTSCHTFTLAAETAEYKKVQDKFQATCKQTIIMVEHNQ